MLFRALLLACTLGTAPAFGNPNPRTRLLIVAGQSNMLNWHAAASAVPADSGDASIPFYFATGAPPSQGWEQPVNSTSFGRWTHLRTQRQEPYVKYEREFFGPEISLARTLRRATGEAIAVIKIGFFGTTLAEDWNPDATTGNRLYKKLLDEVKRAQTGWAETGAPPLEFAGFFWMQGETDARTAGHASQYETGLRTFIARVRRDLASPGLPCVIGRIGPPPTKGYPFQEQVREGQVRALRDVPAAAWSDTDDLPRDTDEIHLLAPGVLTLGERWAHAWLGIHRSPQDASDKASHQ